MKIDRNQGPLVIPALIKKELADNNELVLLDSGGLSGTDGPGGAAGGHSAPASIAQTIPHRESGGACP